MSRRFPPKQHGELCTTATLEETIKRLSGSAQVDDDLRAIRDVRHLPQGAPTSSALANRVAWRFDVRLDGLARAAGANYTRHADYLALSGLLVFRGKLRRFTNAVTTIVRDEEIQVNA